MVFQKRFSLIISLLLPRMGISALLAAVPFLSVMCVGARMSALSAAVHAPYKTSLAASSSEAVSALESEWLDADSTSDAALSSS